MHRDLNVLVCYMTISRCQGLRQGGMVTIQIGSQTAIY